MYVVYISELGADSDTVHDFCIDIHALPNGQIYFAKVKETWKSNGEIAYRYLFSDTELNQETVKRALELYYDEDYEYFTWELTN